MALKHCLHSFLKQSDSLSTSLCPLLTIPSFRNSLSTGITWHSVCHFPDISLLLSSHCWGKLSIHQVGPPDCKVHTFLAKQPIGEGCSRPAFKDWHHCKVSFDFFHLHYIFSSQACSDKILLKVSPCYIDLKPVWGWYVLYCYRVMKRVWSERLHNPQVI